MIRLSEACAYRSASLHSALPFASRVRSRVRKLSFFTDKKIVTNRHVLEKSGYSFFFFSLNVSVVMAMEVQPSIKSFYPASWFII